MHTKALVPWFLLILGIRIQPRREIIDIEIVLEIVFLVDAEDLTREFFFQGFLAALGFEALCAAAGRFGVGPEVLA
jgi:hypothetical protein